MQIVAYSRKDQLRYTLPFNDYGVQDMEYWQEFLRYEHANGIMMAVGAVLVFISILKIVKSSLKLLLWVLIAGVGAASIAYGFEHSPYDLPALNNLTLDDIKEMAPGVNNDVLQYLCQKFDLATGN